MHIMDKTDQAETLITVVTGGVHPSGARVQEATLYALRRICLNMIISLMCIHSKLIRLIVTGARGLHNSDQAR